MNTRFAKSADKDKIKQLWEYSFSDSNKNVEYYFDKRYKNENSYLIEDNDTFVGALQLNPYKMRVGSYEEDVSYVVGVSIEPEYRGMGYSSILLKNSLKELYARGENISILMPIDTNIYLRYGYINTFARHSYTMNLQNIILGKAKCSIERIREINDENFIELEQLYIEAANSKRAAIIRDKAYFINKLGELHVDNGELYIIRDNGKAVGYFMFIAKYEIDKALVLEAVFENISALSCIFTFMRSHITQASSIEMNFVDHKSFEIATKFSNRYTISKSHFMMARVIRAKNILGKVFQTVLDAQILTEQQWDMLDNKVIVKVNDDLIEENNQYFQIEYDGAEITVSNSTSTKSQMIIGIAELTQLYMRSAKLSNIMKYEDLQISDNTLENFLSFYEITKSSYINDYI